MTGDQQDMMARLRTVLPTRWFPDSAPVLDGLLSGLASGWSWAYQQLQYVKAQTRIATATDVWLDIIANDYFGNRLADGQDKATERSAVGFNANCSGNVGRAAPSSRCCKISQGARRWCSSQPERPIPVATRR